MITSSPIYVLTHIGEDFITAYDTGFKCPPSSSAHYLFSTSLTTTLHPTIKQYSISDLTITLHHIIKGSAGSSEEGAVWVAAQTQQDQPYMVVKMKSADRVNVLDD